MVHKMQRMALSTNQLPVGEKPGAGSKPATGASGGSAAPSGDMTPPPDKKHRYSIGQEKGFVRYRHGTNI